jgi:hypothetical protein
MEALSVVHAPHYGQPGLLYETFSDPGAPDGDVLLRSEAADCYMLYGSPATR